MSIFKWVIIVMLVIATFPIEQTLPTRNIPQSHTSASESDHGMVYVPAGKFIFGSTLEEISAVCKQEFSNERFDSCIEYHSEHVASLSGKEIEVEGFWMDKYEVTIEYHTDCLFCDSIDFSQSSMSYLSQNLQQPQVGVTWYDAMMYCNLRNARLPTEIEWEYAASGPENLIFPWGNSYTRENLIPEDMEKLTTHLVGSIPENVSWAGIYDLSGNAAEWVEELYMPNVVVTLTQDIPRQVDRTVRGGAWDTRKFTLTTFWREPSTPWEHSHFVGFRCVSSEAPPED
jgi:formylglycine-generating enzyme required for sulfatase activity